METKREEINYTLKECLNKIKILYILNINCLLK